jgi:nitroreductase
MLAHPIATCDQHENAIRMPIDISPERAPELQSGFDALVRERRSIYSYLPKPVPVALLRKAIEAAVVAPNHHRTHPWRFFVFSGAGRGRLALAYEAAAKRVGRDVPKAVQRVYDAPVMVVIACISLASNAKVKAWEEQFATAAATQNLMLSLAGSSLSTLLTTGELAESPEVKELVGLAQEPEAKLMGVLNVGYRNPERPLPARAVQDIDAVTQWFLEE